MTDQLAWQFEKDWTLPRNIAEALARFARKFGQPADVIVLHVDHRGVDVEGVDVEWTKKRAHKKLVMVGKR